MRKAFFVALLLILFVYSSKILFAQENNSATSEAFFLSQASLSYQLPYPGLLPDSPLYVFKIARDWFVDFLISDPVKKVEFYILQADKRLNAGVYLMKNKKTELAEQTISKGENYFESAITKTYDLKKQGVDIEPLVGKLSTSVAKHKETIDEFQKKYPKEFDKSFVNIGKRIDQFEKKINVQDMTK